MKARREQAARQQRWSDAGAMIRFVISNILDHPHDRQIKAEYEELLDRNDERLKSKQSDEQIILKAIRCGCETVELIGRETGLTSGLINQSLKELERLGKVTPTGDRWQLKPKE